MRQRIRLNRTLHRAPHGRRRIPISDRWKGDATMNNIAYLVGAVVIVLAILSFPGLR
jgi:uncharacterized membrane protein YkgB